MFKSIKLFLKAHRLEIGSALFFLIMHLPFLGHEMFNTDVWKWKARSYDFGEGIFTLNFDKTIQKYHPGVTLLWIGTVAIKLYNGFYDVFMHHPPVDNVVSTVFELHFVQKFVLLIVLTATLFAILVVLRRYLGNLFVVIFSLLLTFEPFVYALTRVYHLEGLMSLFMLASFIYYYDYLFRKTRQSLVFSALFGAFALLTKTTSLFLLPMIGLMSLLDVFIFNSSSFQERFTQKIKHVARQVLGWLSIVVSVFVLSWPAMWVYPLRALQVMYRGIFTIGIEKGHEQVYFGVSTLDPGASFYPAVLVLRLSPILLLGFLLSLFLLRKLNEKEKLLYLYTLLFMLFYLIELTIPSKKLDRYILPLLLCMLLLASLAYTRLLHYFSKTQRLFAILVFSLFGIYTIWYLQADYFSYYNPLVGGLSTGISVLEPKWMIGQHEIEKFLSTLDDTPKDRKFVIAFPEKYFTQVYPFVRERNMEPVIADIPQELLRTDYLIVPVWFLNNPYEGKVDLVFVTQITLRGVPLYNVFKVK